MLGLRVTASWFLDFKTQGIGVGAERHCSGAGRRCREREKNTVTDMTQHTGMHLVAETRTLVDKKRIWAWKP